MKPVRVEVNDKMQKGYVYFRTKPMGRAFRPGFTPKLMPKQMLELGVFGGKYMTDCREEFPASWFKRAKLSPDWARARALRPRRAGLRRTVWESGNHNAP